MKKTLLALATASILTACGGSKPDSQLNEDNTNQMNDSSTTLIAEELLAKYTSVDLSSDISHLDENQKKMLGLLIDAVKTMDDLFWQQTLGNKEEFLNSISNDKLKEFAQINYGPWDRLNNNAPFIDGYKAKALGANYYPKDMTKEEFDNAELENKTSLYTLIKRDEQNKLIAVPYHIAYQTELTKASNLLKQAAELATDADFKNYLLLRAEALLNDNFLESDLAWMDMKNNLIDVVIGPIENYDDQLFNYKAAYEGYVLVKDVEWSKKLEKYVSYLPELQKNLPVEEKYKNQAIGTDADLNAYDVVYYAGDCNSGSKTIAINLPNDERVQQQKGTRRLQLKNAMRAKYDKILMPIADLLIAEDQRQYISFDAFFGNTMFHEVAHGLGIKKLISDTSITVSKALKEQSTALEEGKADILGLYMVTELHKKGEIENDLMENYVTFMASIFRSIRFGASSAHGRANMLRFNYFVEQGAFERNEATGTYAIDFEKMKIAMNNLSGLILQLQGDGDYDAVVELMETKGTIDAQLQADLDRLAEEGIPVDVVFNQGKSVLGI